MSTVPTNDEQLRTEVQNRYAKAALQVLGSEQAATLIPGERVLDLGSGGGIDVLLSARRVAPGGFAYGLDMTDAMLELAERNRAEASIFECITHKPTSSYNSCCSTMLPSSQETCKHHNSVTTSTIARVESCVMCQCHQVASRMCYS